MPRSNEHLNPRLLLYSHSLLTILNAMSSYGGPAWILRMHVSPCLLPSGMMVSARRLCLVDEIREDVELVPLHRLRRRIVVVVMRLVVLVPLVPRVHAVEVLGFHGRYLSCHQYTCDSSGASPANATSAPRNPPSSSPPAPWTCACPRPPRAPPPRGGRNAPAAPSAADVDALNPSNVARSASAPPPAPRNGARRGEPSEFLRALRRARNASSRALSSPSSTTSRSPASPGGTGSGE